MIDTLRLAILWTSLSGYFNACLHTLSESYRIELDVTRITRSGAKPHPYDEEMFAWLPRLRSLPENSVVLADDLLDELKQFDPHAVIVSGWSSPVYRKVVRAMRQESVYVIGTADNPWHGTLRQWGGVLLSPLYVRPLFDALWVPGERAANFARRLGFNGEHLLSGLYSADQPHFAGIFEERQLIGNAPWPRRFLFAGRLAPEKGVQDLVAAYRRYREVVVEPWELWVAGTGPLAPLLENEPGVRMLGFVQPNDYSELLKQVGVFVLPSHYDPWPLVIHEMTSAGLPILCSRQCGSSVELVQDGFNGFTFDAKDVPALARLFERISGDKVDLPLLGKRSTHLSLRYSPAQWADYLINHLAWHVDAR